MKVFAVFAAMTRVHALADELALELEEAAPWARIQDAAQDGVEAQLHA